MKKTNIITIAAAAVCSATLLTACAGNGTGGGADSSKYVGHWNVTSMEAGGESLDIQALMNAVGSEDTDSVGLDIKQDGNFTLNVYGQDENKGTWKESGGNSIILTINGDDQNVTLNGDKLEMSYGEGDQKLTLIFTKDGASSEKETKQEETTAGESTAAETEATEETTASE